MSSSKPTPFLFRFFMPSIFDILVVIVLVVMFMAHTTLKDYDVWWHLRTGQLLLSGVFPKVDNFSYTALGKLWILHEWGSEIIFYSLFKQFGVAGILLLRALIAALVIGVIYKTMLKRHIDIFIALFLSLGVLFTTAIIWGERPHLFTVLFLSLLIYFYKQYKYSGKTTLFYILPLMFMAWVNLHGGFIIGFIYLGTCIFAQLIAHWLQLDQEGMSLRKTLNLAGISLVSFLMCFFNPNTYKGVLYPLMYIGDQMPDFHQMIEEWYAASWSANKDFILLFIFIFFMLALSRIRPKLEQLFIFMVFSYFAFSAQRHIPLFSLIVLPMFARQIQDNVTRAFAKIKAVSVGKTHTALREIGHYFSTRSTLFLGLENQLNLHGALILLVGVFSYFVLSGQLDQPLQLGSEDKNFPFAMVRYLKDRPVGNIFNDYGWGGFLLWQLPERRVFIDGRLDVYRKTITEEYFKVVKLQPGWQDVLKKYNIRYILLDKDQTASRFLPYVSQEWQQEWATGNAVLLSRKNYSAPHHHVVTGADIRLSRKSRHDR